MFGGILATIQLRILYLPVWYLETQRLEYTKRKLHLFLWARDFGSHIKGGTQIEGVWEHVQTKSSRCTPLERLRGEEV
jgi:hypothetical protein